MLATLEAVLLSYARGPALSQGHWGKTFDVHLSVGALLSQGRFTCHSRAVCSEGSSNTTGRSLSASEVQALFLHILGLPPSASLVCVVTCCVVYSRSTRLTLVNRWMLIGQAIQRPDLVRPCVKLRDVGSVLLFSASKAQVIFSTMFAQSVFLAHRVSGCSAASCPGLLLICIICTS